MKKTTVVRITTPMICRILSRNAETIETPESKLWMAVLTSAIMDLDDKGYKREAERFFTSTRFETICNFVGLLPEYVREIIDHRGFDFKVST